MNLQKIIKNEMIIEFTKNKMTAETRKDLLDQVRMFFLNNPEIWFKEYELIMFTGIASVRKYINKIRCEGLPIISSKKGYKLTTNNDEIVKCYEELRNRALRTLTAAKLMKKNINKNK